MVDRAKVAPCNDEVFDRAGEAPDVIAAGPPRSRRPGGPFRLLVLAQAAALVASIAVALHYRAEADRTPATGAPPPASPAASPSRCDERGGPAPGGWGSGRNVGQHRRGDARRGEDAV